MKKIVALSVLFLLAASALHAEVRLRMESPRSIVLTADNPCEKLAAIEMFVDDDPPTGDDNKVLLQAIAETSNGTDDENTPVVYKGQPDWPFISKFAFSRATDESIFSYELPDDFDSIRGRIIRDIQRVNWPTGYQISQADMSFKQRFQQLFGKVCAFAVPAINAYGNAYGVSVSEQKAKKVGEKLAENIQYSLLDYKLKKEVRYTPEGLYFAIITNKPFLFLTLDDEVFDNLLKVEEQLIKQYGRSDKDRLLVQMLLNMEKFFDLREKFHQDDDFIENTKQLYKFTKLSAGDAWSTYKVLADHSIRMDKVSDEHQLNEKYEKNTFLPLKKVFINIGKDVAKHKTEVAAIRKDPRYKEMVSRVDKEYQHTFNLKDEAAKELKDMKEQDKELIMRAYKK